MRKKVMIVVILLMTWHLTADADRMQIFRSGNWEWNELETLYFSPKAREDLAWLKKNLGLNDARRVCGWLAELAKPENISEMADFPARQRRLGGGFYGMLPGNDEALKALPVPRGRNGIIRAAAELAGIKKKNLKAIGLAMQEYPMTFAGVAMDFPRTAFKKPGGMVINLNLNTLQQLLAAFNAPEFSRTEALALARSPEFTQMLQHRRDLGYVPEPLPDEESLAEFMVMAASREPSMQLWKWLSPCNLFSMSDLYDMRHDYAGLLKELDKNRGRIERMMLARFHALGIRDLCFTESIDFAVNWGVRSWATESALGTNITMFKDNFPAMFRTLTHEIFHRLQLRICPGRVPENRKRSFEDLVAVDSGTKEERKFYEVLAYIFLEGSGSYAGGIDPEWEWKSKLRKGGVLLEDIRSGLFERSRKEKADSLLNQGLKSNGPFYALGYYMCRRIAEKESEAVIQSILRQGCVAFFHRYLKLEPDTDLISPELKRKILKDMAKYLQDEQPSD